MASFVNPAWHGVMPYIVTPLDKAGNVNRPVLAKLVDDLVAAGVNGLAPLGSTGEFAYLTAAQRLSMVEATVEAARGRVPVIAGVASCATDIAVAQAQAYERAGANGILAVMEAYFPVSQEGVVSYFRSVAHSVSLPVVLYTNPNYQRSDLGLDAIEELSHEPNIVALKDASYNTGRLLSVMARVAGRMDVFAASAHITAAVLLIGGKGWMAGPACLLPRASVELYRLCKAGKWNEAMALQHRLWRINEVFTRYQMSACVKAGLQMQGYDVGDPIAPQASLGEEGRIAVRAILEEFGAL